jgi:hypothetical protein
MSEYNPDRWVMLKITSGGLTTYKVLAGWGGSYLYGQSWKLNSGVTKVESEDNYYLFSGYSGSVYRCHKEAYGTTGYSAQILAGFQKDAEEAHIQLEVMPEETNWMEIDYGE